MCTIIMKCSYHMREVNGTVGPRIPAGSPTGLLDTWHRPNIPFQIRTLNSFTGSNFHIFTLSKIAKTKGYVCCHG